MFAIMHNRITCAWPDCLQVGDCLVAHDDIVLEYCERHVARALHREDIRRAERHASGVASGASGRGR